MKELFVINFIFFFGIIGLFIIRKNLILLLVSIELIFLAINMNFLIFSVYLDDIVGQIYGLCILTIAAAEAAIGLSIIVVFYRLRGGISLDLIKLLKG